MRVRKRSTAKTVLALLGIFLLVFIIAMTVIFCVKVSPGITPLKFGNRSVSE